ncbi:MAG: aquaporin family protein [Acidimicrobiia bacterium]|nr:aquaporin family protein [Acidimicrobiia bacterium]
MKTLGRQALAEFLGTGLLVTVVVGSGIAAQRLSPGDTGLQLLENAAATAGGLIALILAFGSVSGAHFNPVVSLVDWRLGGLTRTALGVYIAAQTVGAVLGCWLANLMFEAPVFELSTRSRSSGALWVSEVVATVGLLLVIFGSGRGGNRRTTPFAVGLYIGGAYFFTSSTSFANPAVTLGRMFSDTFAGIAPGSVAPFVVAQLVGGLIGLALVVILFPSVDADATLVPHSQELA